jgi:two-component system, chemotaxis family, protein-glutamate methylesterase/glutaminase
MIRVLIAEDSATVRELLVEILTSDPDIRVVGQASNGADAVRLAAELRPDVITMDIHMPVMDGFDATRAIMTHSPVPIVVVSSSTSKREIELSLDATRAGALIALAKPESPASPEFAHQRHQLVTMVKAMAQVRVVRRWTPRPSPSLPTPVSGRAVASRVRLVAIAASTGGPAALQRILSDLPATFPVPIVIVQHIATGFVTGLAAWLENSCKFRVRVARHAEPLEKRTAYLAPDDHHLGVDAKLHAIVRDDPAVNGFRPSGTYLFESAARACSGAMAAVILTGMGNDGVAGLRAVKAANGHGLAQDESSSVVFGMPAEAIKAGLVDDVVPVNEMAARLIEIVGG